MKWHREEPKQGKARKIWQALVENNLTPIEIHYNPNCWGKGSNNGWGTWACSFRYRDGVKWEGWCGILADGTIYIQGMSAPYNFFVIKKGK